MEIPPGGTEEHREDGMSLSVKRRRILAIDGGGIKGVFPAAFLSGIEEALDRPLREYFDLVVGTSTGGIIALGLGLGFSASDILHFYEEFGPAIFGGGRRVSAVRSVYRPKYDPTPLRAALASTFGQRQLGESTTRLVIPALDLENGRVHVKKTAHHARCEMDYRDLAVDVAMGTASAPTYFPTHRTLAGVPLIDGGTWANNPAGVAAVEAIGVLGWGASATHLLSIGCTDSPLDLSQQPAKGMGLRHWSTRIITVMMAAQSSGALGTAQILLGHSNVHRISPIVGQGRFKLDRVSDLPSLRGLGAAEARNYMPRIRETFFNTPADAFTPTKRL
ncbi:CBASS cGAMP-activated phospholipase [Mycolicibacterium baixiangningiae]|uniref:CBASS cGAMP-activated phospholipase n=1 Tax=Mycolicibacterium baixiangningiae TaxID=2761578 RepID=UPI0018D009B8|nr:CBASS cGAMP-activated phospholipase [Mycolicibacterium baixiangningiae]